ncbi:MAG: hypothetical protein CL681_20915 [Blastopirellula sp.]|nr:hypothetical protein [Blastopirellula sp.]
MKSERRHELQNNELAAIYDQYADQIKLGSKIGAVAVGVLVIGIAVWAYSSNSEQTKLAQGWEALDEALSGTTADTEALTEMADEYQGSPAGHWARKTAADRTLATGIQELRMNREDATKKINDAIEIYKDVENQGGTMLQQQVFLGLGKAYESLSDVDQAKTYYQKTIAKDSASALGKYAEERMAFLSNENNVAFLDWFAKQKPRPPAMPSVPGMTPGGAGNDLPAAPDISLDGDGISFEGIGSSLDNKNPPAEAPAEAPPAEAPAEAPPAEAPAETPAETPPAEGPAEAPAENPPAEKPDAEGAATDESSTSESSEPAPPSDDAGSDANADAATDAPE